MISVLITAYNAQETIGNAVKSAVNQDWPNKEIIVYDDCSTDGTVEIIKKLGKFEPQIKILYGKENMGVALEQFKESLIPIGSEEANKNIFATKRRSRFKKCNY